MTNTIHRASRPHPSTGLCGCGSHGDAYASGWSPLAASRDPARGVHLPRSHYYEEKTKVVSTFVDPVAEVAEAYAGLRGLAYATRSFENHADTFRVFAGVSGSVQLLRQVLDQVSRAHADHRERAFTDDGLTAKQIALLAADQLHQAADVLDGVEGWVMRAHEASGRIAWHDQPAPERSAMGGFGLSPGFRGGRGVGPDRPRGHAGSDCVSVAVGFRGGDHGCSVGEWGCV